MLTIFVLLITTGSVTLACAFLEIFPKP